MPFATRSALRAHHQRKRQAMKTHGVSAAMGTRTDGSATSGCPGRLQHIFFQKCKKHKFFRMPFAARSALTGHPNVADPSVRVPIAALTP